MAKDNRHYVLLDAMGIQDYIFETNTLKIILGASLELARWQNECAQLASTHKGTLVSSAGGNVLAWFDSPADADSFRKDCLKAAPPGMEIAWALSEYQGNDLDTWQALQKEIVRYKAGHRDPGVYPELESREAPGCLFCGKRPQNNQDKIKGRPVCSRCGKLHKTGSSLCDRSKKNDNGTMLERLFSLDAKYKGIYPDSLEDIVDYDGVKDLLAVAVIDLNDMGERIKGIVRDKGFDELATFSIQLEKDIEEILKKRILELAKEPDGFDIKNQLFRIRPLFAAGDDIVLAMPACCWQLVVPPLLKSLEEKGYFACAGVAVAKHSFPINRLIQMAETLTDNAKGQVRNHLAQDENKGKSGASALDWHVHQETALTNPVLTRKKDKVAANMYIMTTAKPWLLDEYRDYLEKMKEEFQAFPKQISNRKLFMLYDALNKGPIETRDVLKFVFFRDDNARLENYRPIWNLFEKDSRYPLWRAHDAIDGNEAFYTRVADLLELCMLETRPGKEEH